MSRIHFTVSPEHEAGFRALLEERLPYYERRFGIKYDISFSQQKPSTDTIAATPGNEPFRTDGGELLFRPAGHGALIENLDEIDADIIFIKNIDNVTTDARRGDTVVFKKVLAGVLLDRQERTFAHLRALRAGDADLAEVAGFIRRELCVKLPENYDAALLEKILDRPGPRMQMGCATRANPAEDRFGLRRTTARFAPKSPSRARFRRRTCR